jgi:hypothetical protein
MQSIDECINELYKKKIWFNFRNKERKIQALKLIAELGNPYTIPSIFRFIFSLNNKISNQTAQTIHILMSQVKQSQWTQLCHSFHNIEISKEQFAYLSYFPESYAIDLLGIASLNWNGYIRQKAIYKLQETNSPQKIPYIMLRLGDWVPQVRKTAEQAILECFKQEYTEAFLQYTYIIDWMMRVERIDLSHICDQIVNHMVSSSSNEYLKQLLDHPDDKVRFFSYKALLKRINDNAKVIEKGAKDPNSRIRWYILQHIYGFTVGKMIQYLPFFLQDPSPTICSSSMMEIPEDQWQDFKCIIFEKMFSNSATIRNTARFILRKHGFNTFADEYRNRIKSQQISPGILYGLAETGTKDDFALLENYIHHPKSKMRVAVIAGLYRLDAEKSISIMIASLRDSNTRVRQTSSKILRKYQHFDRYAVRCILRDGTSESKVTALNVLCYFSSWEALEDILSLLTDSDEKIRITAWHHCVKWYLKHSAKNWIKPSPPVLCSVETKIKELNLKQIEIPNSAESVWRDLPNLIESGKQIGSW